MKNRRRGSCRPRDENWRFPFTSWGDRVNERWSGIQMNSYKVQKQKKTINSDEWFQSDTRMHKPDRLKKCRQPLRTRNWKDPLVLGWGAPHSGTLLGRNCLSSKVLGEDRGGRTTKLSYGQWVVRLTLVNRCNLKHDCVEPTCL